VPWGRSWQFLLDGLILFWMYQSENLAKKIAKRRKEKETVSLKTSQKGSDFCNHSFIFEKIKYTGKGNYEIRRN